MSIDQKVELQKQDIEYIYSDEDVLVVGKPCNLCTTLDVNYNDSLQKRVMSIEGFETFSPSHRLDMTTSGIVIGGLSRRGKRSTGRQISKKNQDSFSRLYLALVDGVAEEYDEIINLIDGKYAHTEYVKVHDQIWNGAPEPHNAVLVKTHTGRRHQIRSHLDNKGIPIHGDPIYNDSVFYVDQDQYLHSACMKIRLPGEEQSMTFVSIPSWIPEELKGDFKDKILYYADQKNLRNN